MLNHYKILRQYYENGAYNHANRIISDPESDSFGTVLNCPKEYRNVAEIFVNTFIFVIAYYLEGTKCYRDSLFLEKADDALSGGERYMHEDGTIDLRVTNFHDPTYCGFCVRDYLGPSLEILRKYTKHTALEDKVDAHLTRIIKKMGQAMENFGFHTPNHRWIICSALSFVKNLTGDKAAGETMKKYFWEGIDCDENGEYTERSTGLYNLICNQSFLELAHTEDEKFLEYPIRNMRLMRSYYEPDDTICTMNSMRQDKGSVVSVDTYYVIYLPLALYTKDPEFAYYSDRALKHLMADAMRHDGPFECLHAVVMYWFLVNDEWRTDEIFESIESYLPDRDLSKFMLESGIARTYKDGATVTVLRTNSPDFMKIQVGRYGVCARAAGSFFGMPHSQFRPKNIEKTENGYRVSSVEEAGYRSQFDEPPETSVWRHMDHSKRKMLNIQKFETSVDVSFGERCVDVTADFSGADDIPTKFELTFPTGCKVVTDQMVFKARADDYVYFKGGKMKLVYDSATFEIEGGSYCHFDAESMRGSEKVPSGYFTVCFTGMTPSKINFKIKY